MSEPLNINPPERMQKAAVIALSCLSIFLIFKVITEIKSWDAIGSAAQQNTLSVSGKGEVFAVPDVAMIRFTVDETGKTIEEAQSKATEKNNAALNYLKSQRIEEKDIQTESYNANPQYDYNNQVTCVRYPCPPSTPKIVGYQVTQTTVVKVRDTSKAGEILAGIGKVGISNISGPSLSIDDETALKTEARTKAIADAKLKAKELAQELGVRIGKLTSFNESSGGYPMPMYAMESKAMGVGGGGAPDIATGENKVTVEVQLTYQIR